SEEHTSELQSRENLVCRLLLEKKNRGRGMVPACADGPGARLTGQAVSRRGDDLVEVLHHGARALRRRGHRAPAARVRAGSRLGAPAAPVRSPLARADDAPPSVRIRLSVVFCLVFRRPPGSTLFPYTTLFR